MPAGEPDSGHPVLDGLAALRRRIAVIERRRAAIAGAASRTVRPWLPGVDGLDRALPENGLKLDGIHEASGANAADGPAAAAFLAALLARLAHSGRRGTVLVCQSRNGAARSGRLHGPGWRDLGLDPAELLVVRARCDRDVLWAMEEGLRCGALAAVVVEVENVELTASRRLSLAARKGRTPALLLRHDGLSPASAALTRWRGCGSSRWRGCARRGCARSAPLAPLSGALPGRAHRLVRCGVEP